MHKYVTICGKRYPTIEANDPEWDRVTLGVDPKCPVDAAILANVIADLSRSQIQVAFIRIPRTSSRPPLVELCRPRPSTYKAKH